MINEFKAESPSGHVNWRESPQYLCNLCRNQIMQPSLELVLLGRDQYRGSCYFGV